MSSDLAKSTNTVQLSPRARFGRWWLVHSARTAVAAMASITVAGTVNLSEPYWAAVSTIIVTQSTLGTAFEISASRFAGTAVGCAAAVLLGSIFGANVFVFGAGVFGLGMLCLAVGLPRAAYRFGAIAMCIVMMVRRLIPVWRAGLDRFVEVSIGIVVGLAMAALWPLKEPPEG